MTQPDILLAVDADNIRLSIPNGTQPNFGALVELARHLGQPVETAIYLARHNGSDRDSGFLLALKQRMGYTRVVARTLQQRPDGGVKSDVDTALALDTWECAIRKKVQLVILGSGDLDFVPLVERLTERGIAVLVVGPDTGTSWELIVKSTHYLKASKVPGLFAGRETLAKPEPTPKAATSNGTHTEHSVPGTSSLAHTITPAPQGAAEVTKPPLQIPEAQAQLWSFLNKNLVDPLPAQRPAALTTLSTLLQDAEQPVPLAMLKEQLAQATGLSKNKVAAILTALRRGGALISDESLAQGLSRAMLHAIDDVSLEQYCVAGYAATIRTQFPTYFNHPAYRQVFEGTVGGRAPAED